MKTAINTQILTILCIFIQRVYTQSNPCGLEKFQCQTGECIASELLCDGRADCTDSSDETQAECTKPEITCPDYAFRCAYGACVDGDATCNGIKDCVDNSDETLAKCATLSRNDSISATTCTRSQFKCDSGQCINQNDVCDGSKDCRDGSDETFSECGTLNCPQVVFRCAYGACIDGDLQCNGVINCADGSDEDPKLCGGTTRQPERPTARPTTRRPTTVTPSIPTRPEKFCTAPSYPHNGLWKLQCSNGEDCHAQPGAILEPGTQLVYTCNRGYKVRGSSDVFCNNKGKFLNIPVCVEIRCKVLTSASTDALCTHNDEWVSCETPVLPGTKAKLTCRNSYQQDRTLLSRQRADVRCNQNGQWEPEPIRCIPECGVQTLDATPLIVNGTQAKINEFPWHATLYRAETANDAKEFVCGATIIQDNLLITAAHCVYDESTKVIIDPKQFFVATGNIFQQFDSPFHDPNIVKKAEVKNIYIVCSYLGLEGNYAWDIAILELVNPFVFSALLMPACLETSSYSDQNVLEAGNFGKVAGFGRTATGPTSQVLQTITVPYIPTSQCKPASIIYDTQKYITIDKFCAGYTNGSSVCDGDSGGGLVFKTGGLWYLRGIVSVGLGAIKTGGSRICDSHVYSFYTRISSHIAWIQDVILKLETYKSYPSCQPRG